MSILPARWPRQQSWREWSSCPAQQDHLINHPDHFILARRFHPLKHRRGGWPHISHCVWQVHRDIIGLIALRIWREIEGVAVADVWIERIGRADGCVSRYVGQQRVNTLHLRGQRWRGRIASRPEWWNASDCGDVPQA